MVLAAAVMIGRVPKENLKPAAAKEETSSFSVRPSSEIDACVNAATEAYAVAKERACDEEKDYHIAAFEACLKKGETVSSCRSEWPNSRKESCVLSPAAAASLAASYEAAKEECRKN